ncbi:MAG TPA: hypothetical protein VGI28_03575 [Stellaceae bacterium]
MTNLTGAKRAKRYRQRKAGKAVPPSPRATRPDRMRGLYFLARTLSEAHTQPGSLRSFYRQRAQVLYFVKHASVDIIKTRLTEHPEATLYIRGRLTISEWRDFLRELEALGVAVEDKQHGLEMIGVTMAEKAAGSAPAL